MTWTTATLGEVCEIVSGATPRTGISDYWDGKIEWATPADLSKLSALTIESTDRRITEAGLASCAARVLPAGSVLFSSRAPIGHVAINTVPMATNQGFKSMVPKAGVLDSRYLAFWLRANKPYLQSLGTGATFKEVSKSVVSRVEIALPPISEQRRIAAILDQADAQRAKRRRSLALLDDLQRSIFLDMFGDPLRNPYGLRQASVGSIAEVITGNSPPRSDVSNFGSTIEWIKSGNLGSEVATTATEWLSDIGRARARVAPAGSILVTCIAGSPASIGKASRVDRAAAFNQQINAILPSDEIDPVFLLGQLKVAPALVRAKSTQGMKGLVNRSSFKSIELLTPPLAEQRAYASRVDAVCAQRQAQQASMRELDALFASLQSRAFSGDLTLPAS